MSNFKVYCSYSFSLNYVLHTNPVKGNLLRPSMKTYSWASLVICPLNCRYLLINSWHSGCNVVFLMLFHLKLKTTEDSRPSCLFTFSTQKCHARITKLICGKKRYSLNRNYSQTILKLYFSVSAIKRQISCYDHWIDRISHLRWGNKPVFMMSPLTSTYFRIIHLNVFLQFSCQDSMCSNPEQPWRLFISKMFIISSHSFISVQTEYSMS